MSSTSSDKQKQQEIIQRHLKDIDQLPSLPAVVPRLLEILNKPDSNAQDVSEVLRMDPGLTAKVFKLINSAYYGLRRKINSVREAITFIGFNTVRNLALTAGVLDKLSEEMADQPDDVEFDWYEFWKYSIATGIAADTVGRYLRTPNNENAMASGILHRLGLVVLYTHFGQLYEKVLEKHRENNKYLLATQNDILEFNEQDIGFWLARDWSFPESISAGIGYHNRPLEYPDHPDDVVIGEIPSLVNIGKAMARQAGFRFSLDEKEPVFDSDVLARLELSRDNISTLMEQFKDDIEDASAFMELVEEMKEG